MRYLADADIFVSAMTACAITRSQLKREERHQRLIAQSW